MGQINQFESNERTRDRDDRMDPLQLNLEETRLNPNSDQIEESYPERRTSKVNLMQRYHQEAKLSHYLAQLTRIAHCVANSLS
jgi:hypothetical protein